MPPATRAEGFNPLCGDEIVVDLMLDDPARGDDAVVTEIAIGGQGCSISQSSASMMSAAVKGRTVGEVRELSRSFKAMMSIHEGELDSADAPDDEVQDLGMDQPGASLGDLEALRGVVKFPVRIKCATLSWNTLADGLQRASSD